MLRVRNVPGDEAPRPTLRSSSPNKNRGVVSAPAASGNRRVNYHDHEKKKLSTSSQSIFRALIMIGLAAVITVLTYWVTPNENVLKQEAEHVAKAALAAEHELEREMMDWWSQHGHQKPPIPQEDLSSPSQGGGHEANRWVDGEKRLKQELKKLAERQQRGKDIGVPVLTRWLGDDIPAYAGEGVDVKEWTQKVDEKYKQMRQEEVQWQKQISALLEREKNRG